MEHDVFSQTGYKYRFDWGEDGVKRLAPVSDLIVLVDVLSFTTCVNVATERGAVVYPYRFKDASAMEFAKTMRAELAGGRGSALSLSPASLISIENIERIVLPSPNGATCTVLAADFGCTVVAGSLRNASSVADFIRPSSVGTVSIIACGERWKGEALRPSFEDLIGAGAILSHLEADGLSPESRSAVGAFQYVKASLHEALCNCASGRELIARGYRQDIQIASALNVSCAVPVMAEQAYGSVNDTRMPNA